MSIRIQTLSALTFLFLPLAASAATKHLLVAPACLIQSTQLAPSILAKQGSLLLISADDKSIKILSEAKHRAPTPCGGFFDVTDSWHAYQQINAHQSSAAFLAEFSAAPVKSHLVPTKYAIRYEKQVNELIGQLNPPLMWDKLTTFSSARDRYADSDDGIAAAKWIGEQISDIAKAAGRDDVTVSFINTKDYLQPSVVVKVGNSSAAGVVVGAHLDTPESEGSNMPGADDDGSGSMTVLESARTVISSGMQFKKPIYYIWYAAEEEGMKGSQGVVADFKKKKIKVDGVLHFDMTGFAYKNTPDIWVFDDNVDKGLSTFLATIITTYTQQPVKHSRCGYACSDHASWNQAGYKAVLPGESRFEDTNQAMHTSRDTMDKLSLKHMTDYAKIATAFTVEMAEPAA